MFEAEVYINGKWENKNANELNREDRKRPMRCPLCKAPAIICFCAGNRSNYFRSNMHTADCDNAVGGKIIKAPRRKVPVINDMMGHKDNSRELDDVLNKMKSAAKDKPDQDDDDFIEETVDNITDDRDIELHKCSSIYQEFLNMPLDTKLDIGLELRDYLICKDTIQEARNTLLTGPKMFIAARCKAPFSFSSEYICLRDAFSFEDKDTIFLLVKCEDPVSDTIFRYKIFGNERLGIERDPHKYIVVTGTVEKEINDQFTIYKLSPLSEARYCFTNKKKRDD